MLYGRNNNRFLTLMLFTSSIPMGLLIFAQSTLFTFADGLFTRHLFFTQEFFEGRAPLFRQLFRKIGSYRNPFFSPLVNAVIDVSLDCFCYRIAVVVDDHRFAYYKSNILNAFVEP